MPERDAPDAPRWTTEVYYKGFRILITRPFENTGAIVGMMNELCSLGFTPAKGSLTEPQSEILPPVPPEKKESGKESIPICPTHHKEMVLRKGQFGNFWACPTQENGKWCNYRPPKK